MKLCSFYARSPAGRLQRVGIALDDGRLLDAHNAYATMLAERDGHPCAWALAAVLAPTDMAALVAAGLGVFAILAQALGAAHWRELKALRHRPKDGHTEAA